MKSLSSDFPDRFKPGTIKKHFGLFFIYAVLVLFALAYIIPFLWLLSGSLKTSTELFSNPPVWIPAKPVLENYVTAFRQFPFFRYLGNTMTIVLFNILGSILSSSFIAYGFSKIEWKLREPVFFIVLLTMMLPFQVVMIPLFLLFNRLGWIGTFLPLIVPAFMGHPFSIFLFRQFFLTIPEELSQSARIDGAGELGIFIRIVFPLAKSAAVTVAIFSFLHNWSDFIGPLVFLNDNKLYTLSLGVQQIMSQNDPRWPLLMTVGVSMTLPVLIIFFLLQKYFIEGIAMSGIKG